MFDVILNLQKFMFIYVRESMILPRGIARALTSFNRMVQYVLLQIQTDGIIFGNIEKIREAFYDE